MELNLTLIPSMLTNANINNYISIMPAKN
jgi:hypothetical protein